MSKIRLYNEEGWAEMQSQWWLLALSKESVMKSMIIACIKQGWRRKLSCEVIEKSLLVRNFRDCLLAC